MRRVTMSRLAWVVPFALLAAACGDETTTTPTTPTTPTTTVSVTDVFTGSIAQTGSATHMLTTEAGKVTTTLSALGPVATNAIGIDVGTWDGFGCTPVLTNPGALVGSVMIGTASTTITLCVKVYDVGNIAEGESMTYTVEVVHQTKSS